MKSAYESVGKHLETFLKKLSLNRSKNHLQDFKIVNIMKKIKVLIIFIKL